MTRAALAQFALSRFGLALDERMLGRLQEALARVGGGLSLEQLAQQRLEAPRLSALIAAMTNGETYFMRERGQLAALRTWLVARHRSLGRPLQIWSAGCSSGEEAYSLSMLGLSAGVPLSITASDLNAQAIERARQGVYGAWALRDVDPSERAAYFAETPQGFSVIEPVRAQVSFETHNLASMAPLAADGPDPAWDAILCRHVLMYCADPVRGRILAGLEGVLAPDGVLLLAASELVGAASTRLSARRIAGGFFYVLDGGRVSPVSRTDSCRPPRPCAGNEEQAP